MSAAAEMAIVCELLRSGVITRSQLEFHRQQIRGSRNLGSQSTVNGGSLPFFRPAGTVAPVENNFLHAGTTTERTFTRLMGAVQAFLFCQ